MNFDNTTTTGTVTTSGTSHWWPARLVDTLVFDDRIELLYKRQSMFQHTAGVSHEQVYKIVYSCVDGKWNVSDPIFGEIIPATKETYEFEGTPV